MDKKKQLQKISSRKKWIDRFSTLGLGLTSYAAVMFQVLSDKTLFRSSQYLLLVGAVTASLSHAILNQDHETKRKHDKLTMEYWLLYLAVGWVSTVKGDQGEAPRALSQFTSKLVNSSFDHLRVCALIGIILSLLNVNHYPVDEVVLIILSFYLIARLDENIMSRDTLYTIDGKAINANIGNWKVEETEDNQYYIFSSKQPTLYLSHQNGTFSFNAEKQIIPSDIVDSYREVKYFYRAGVQYMLVRRMHYHAVTGLHPTDEDYSEILIRGTDLRQPHHVYSKQGDSYGFQDYQIAQPVLIQSYLFNDQMRIGIRTEDNYSTLDETFTPVETNSYFFDYEVKKYSLEFPVDKPPSISGRVNYFVTPVVMLALLRTALQSRTSWGSWFEALYNPLYTVLLLTTIAFWLERLYKRKIDIDNNIIDPINYDVFHPITKLVSFPEYRFDLQAIKIPSLLLLGFLSYQTLPTETAWKRIFSDISRDGIKVISSAVLIRWAMGMFLNLEDRYYGIPLTSWIRERFNAQEGDDIELILDKKPSIWRLSILFLHRILHSWLDQEEDFIYQEKLLTRNLSIVTKLLIKPEVGLTLWIIFHLLRRHFIYALLIILKTSDPPESLYLILGAILSGILIISYSGLFSLILTIVESTSSFNNSISNIIRNIF